MHTRRGGCFVSDADKIETLGFDHPQAGPRRADQKIAAFGGLEGSASVAQVLTIEGI
jgi:hypothetical protein